MEGVEEALVSKVQTRQRQPGPSSTPADRGDPSLWGELDDPGAPPRWRQVCFWTNEVLLGPSSTPVEQGRPSLGGRARRHWSSAAMETGAIYWI